LGAKLARAGRIVVTDMVEGRRAAAKSLGADVVLDPKAVIVQDEVLGLTGGAGPDVVFESAGVPSTIQEAVNLVKVGGRVGMVGVTFEPAEIIPAIWFLKGVTFMAIPGGDLVASLGVLGRKTVDVKPLITHTVALDQIQEAFEGLLRPTDQIKVLIHP
jgi:threonine dehydrogenase-like Zn-dependent dehydrogenase